MRKLLSLLMGIDECASPAELRRQYQRLITGFVAAEYDCSVDQLRRYLTARERLTIAYEKARKQLSHSEEMHGSVTGSGLLLGELLIDAEIISQEQLEDALQAQSKTKPPLPLGRILVARQLITWEQLAYYLKLQDLLQLPPPISSNWPASLQNFNWPAAEKWMWQILIVKPQVAQCSTQLHVEIGFSRRSWLS